MASNQQLFGDDESSSSDEEQNNATNNDATTMESSSEQQQQQQQAQAPASQEETPRTTTAAAPIIGNGDFDVESSDDDDDDKKNENNNNNNNNNNTATEEEPSTTTTTKPTQPSKSDLFGDDDSDDSDDDEFDEAGAAIVGRAAPEGQVLKTNKPTGLSAAMDMDRSDDEMEGDVPPTPIKEETKIIPPRHMKVLEAASPTSSTSPPKSKSKSKTTIHTTKLPNMLVGIQPEAFQEDTYSYLDEQEMYSDVHNMIRWRYKPNHSDKKSEEEPYERDSQNQLVRESNTRLVQWEDGSYTMHVGNQVFEVDTIDSKTANGFAGINGYMYLSQKATYTSQDPSLDEDQEVIPGGTVLEGMGQVTSKMTVRPSSLQSDAHKNLTVAVRQRHMKQARIAEFVTQVDPEQAKNDRIKLKEDLDKANQRKNRSYGGGGGGRRGGGGRPRMSRGYMEEDNSNYDDVNIGDYKRKRNNEEDYDFGDDDSEDEEADAWTQQRMTRVGKRSTTTTVKEAAGKKGRNDDDDDDDDDIDLGDDSSSDDEEEEEINRHKAPVKKRANLAVFDDDDDDDDD